MKHIPLIVAVVIAFLLVKAIEGYSKAAHLNRPNDWYKLMWVNVHYHQNIDVTGGLELDVKISGDLDEHQDVVHWR